MPSRVRIRIWSHFFLSSFFVVLLQHLFFYFAVHSTCRLIRYMHIHLFLFCACPDYEPKLTDLCVLIFSKRIVFICRGAYCGATFFFHFWQLLNLFPVFYGVGVVLVGSVSFYCDVHFTLFLPNKIILFFFFGLLNTALLGLYSFFKLGGGSSNRIMALYVCCEYRNVQPFFFFSLCHLLLYML